MLQWISYSSLIPPNIFILLAMIGVALAWRWRRGGLVLATMAMACLYLAATPLVGVVLIRSAEALAKAIPSPQLPAPPGAIVVLAGEYRPSTTPGARVRSVRSPSNGWPRPPRSSAGSDCRSWSAAAGSANPTIRWPE